jgi:dihydropteroate synthase
MRLRLRNQTIEFPRPALLMGIVNLSPDSFSGDGHATVEAALQHALALADEGAEIIDVGAESARTNRPAIGAEEEIARYAAFLERWRELPEPKPLLALNTWRPEVVREVLPLGGDLLNDISGLADGENARLCAEHGVGLVIMHTMGAPKVPHTHVRHEDIMATLEAFFAEKMALAEGAGLPREALVLDPGIDFAKQRTENLEIYRELGRLHRFERPILLPVSRKTVIGEVLGLPAAAERDAGTQACIVQGLLAGAQIYRVHRVAAAVQTARMVERVLAAD